MKTKLQNCECSDRLCPAHKGSENCVERAIVILYRIDMEDNTGTAFCEACASDALDTGLFSDSK